jgi:hypothetical protein
MSSIKKQQFVKIGVLENAIEAQLLSSILDQRDIPHQIRSYYDTAYDGLFQIQKGWGELRASLSYRTDILEVLQNIRSQREDF